MKECPLIDIRPDHWRIVEAILKKHVPRHMVWAFGSRAKWSAKAYSDLDLAIITEKALPLAVSASLSDDFSESDLPYKVDVVDWVTTSAAFREIIERDRVVVWEGRSSTKGAAGEWSEIPFTEAVLLNPATPLVKGDIYPFVEMSAIAAGTRDVKCSEYRNFSGGGSRFQDRDTLMARITPCLENGKLARFQAPEGKPIGHGSTEVIVIRGKQNVTDNDYGYYLVISPEVRKFAISQMTGTSGRQRVPTDALGKISVLLPPLTEQKAIAHILGTLDDKIALNRRMNATLEAIAQALFKSWFVDFDPVRAKMEGRAPEGMDEATAALFPDALDDDEKPQGWQKKPLADLIELNPIERLRKGEMAPYLKMSALPTVGSWHQPAVVRSFCSGMKFRNGDTIFSRITPCLENGKTVFIQRLASNEIAWGSTEFIVMRAKGSVPPVYCYLLARDPAFREHAIRSMSGTSGRQRAQVDMLALYLLIAPLDSIWQSFAAVAEPWFEAIKSNSLEIETLAKMRDMLLPKLLSGEIRIKDTEHIAEAIP